MLKAAVSFIVAYCWSYCSILRKGVWWGTEYDGMQWNLQKLEQYMY